MITALPSRLSDVFTRKTSVAASGVRSSLADEALVKNCGTGGGGFKRGNSCARGGSGESAQLSSAIESWWTGGYEQINSDLRSGNGNSEADALLSGIADSEPLAEDAVFLRGMSLPAGSRAAVNMKKGYSVYDDGLIAVTDRQDVASKFAIGGEMENIPYVVSMKVPKGTRMLPVAASGIGERLLPPGRFIVDGVRKKGGVRHVDARWINDKK